MAEWVLRASGRVRIVGNPATITEVDALPPTPFRLSAIDLVGTTVPSTELKRLATATELRELQLASPIFTTGAGDKLDANAELKALASLTKLEKLDEPALSVQYQREG